MLKNKPVPGDEVVLLYRVSARQLTGLDNVGGKVRCAWVGNGPHNILVDIEDGPFVVPVGNAFEPGQALKARKGKQPMTQRTLRGSTGKGFGLSKNPLTIKDNFELWPVTVWEINHSDPRLKALKEYIGDDGTAREHCGTAGYKTSLGSSKNQVSIFNPLIVRNLLNLYPPPEGGVVYDPFGGGGTRAAVCAAHENKLMYYGVELRKDEYEAVRSRIDSMLVRHGDLPGLVHMVHGDSRNVEHALNANIADMLITCPPYYDMEKYDGGEGDLSMAPTYADFLDMLRAVIAEADRILKPGALACWVIGLHRDKDGGLLPMHHDIALIYYDMGYLFKEEIILHMVNTGSVQRVGNFMKGNHLLVRTHEYCVIFQKPDGY